MPLTLINFIMIFVLIMVGFIALVRYLETKGVFFPSHEMAVNPSVIGLPWEDVYFKSKDNVVLNGWFFKNPHAKSTLFFAHGNAGNMSDRLFKVKFFYDLGLNVFIFDYRGYGKSEGSPSEAGIYLDAQGGYDFLQSQGHVDMNNIITERIIRYNRLESSESTILLTTTPNGEDGIENAFADIVVHLHKDIIGKTCHFYWWMRI